MYAHSHVHGHTAGLPNMGVHAAFGSHAHAYGHSHGHGHGHQYGHHALHGMPYSHAAHDLLNDFGYSPSHQWGNDESAIKYSYDIESNKWSEESITVRLRAPAKARGGMRAVYDVEVITREGPVECVAKVSLNSEDGEDVYFLDAKMQNICAKWAADFNAENPPKLISVLPCGVVTIPARRNRKGRQLYFHLEPLLHGTYKKYTNNFGFADSSAVTAQAFSHFTFNASHQSLLVCDIQGVGDVYTDPQIHSMTAIGCVWGKGDMGRSGIEQFFKAHRCNSICDYMNLVHPYDASSPNLAYTPRSRTSVSTPRSSPAYGIPTPRSQTPTPTLSPVDGPLISANEVAEKSSLTPTKSSPTLRSATPPLQPPVPSPDTLPRSNTYCAADLPQLHFTKSIVPTRYSSDISGKNPALSTEDRVAELSPVPTAQSVPVMDKSAKSNSPINAQTVTNSQTQTRNGHTVTVSKTVLPKKHRVSHKKHAHLPVRTTIIKTKPAATVPQEDGTATVPPPPSPKAIQANASVLPSAANVPPSPPAVHTNDRPNSLLQPSSPKKIPQQPASPGHPASPTSATRAGLPPSSSLTKLRSVPASIFDYSCNVCGNKQAIESVAPLPPSHWAFGECSKCKSTNTFSCISECL